MNAARPTGRASTPTATQAAAGLIAVGHDIVGDLSLPDVALSAEFTATGATVPVVAPAGVLGTSLVRVFAHGGPTTAVVVVEGSNDGATWTALPTYAENLSGSLTTPRFAQVRIRATVAGGTSPTVTVLAVVAS